MEGGTLVEKNRNKVSMPKKLKGGLWHFSTSILSQNIKKIERGPLGIVFSRKKVSQCRKKLEGYHLVSPGIVCYAEKEKKPFWFSSLGEMIQFGTINIRRTFENYFGQFVWIEKIEEKESLIIVAFHFMKRRLKINIRKVFIEMNGPTNSALTLGYFKQKSF